MRIILDANILIAALLGSRGRLIILTSQNHEFFVPKKIVEEVKKYEQLICQKAGCTSEEFKENLNALLFFIKAVEYGEYEKHIKEAEVAIGGRDIKDSDYIACALHVKADFVWTDDKDFSAQELVAIKTTDKFIEDGRSQN